MAAVTAGGDSKGVWSEPRWQGLLRIKAMDSLYSLPSVAPPCGLPPATGLPGSFGPLFILGLDGILPELGVDRRKTSG